MRGPAPQGAPGPHSRPSYGYGTSHPPPPPGSSYAPQYPYPQHQQQPPPPPHYEQERRDGGPYTGAERGAYPYPTQPPPPPPPPTSSAMPPSPSSAARSASYGQQQSMYGAHDAGDRANAQSSPQHSSPSNRRHDSTATAAGQTEMNNRGPPPPPHPPSHYDGRPPPPPPPHHQYSPHHGPPTHHPPQSYYEHYERWAASQGDAHRQHPPPPPPPPPHPESRYEQHDHRRPLPAPQSSPQQQQQQQTQQQQQPRPPSDYHGGYRYDEPPIHPSTADGRGQHPAYTDDRYRHPDRRGTAGAAQVTPETRSPADIASNNADDAANSGCTCKKSKCLKLYCQCFAASILCGPDCRCLVCHNTPRHEQDRKEAVRAILSRNPAAFETKFKSTSTVGGMSVSSAKSAVAVEEKVLAHKSGCKCRKSACLKKYCECYHAGVKCNVNCRCVGCQNMPPGGFGPPGTQPMRPDHRHWAAQQYSYAHTAADYNRGRAHPSVHPPPPPPPPPPPVQPQRSEPWMMDAAQNLTFLKHASPEKKHPAAQQEVRDASSVPSLAASDTTNSRSQDDHDGSVSVHHPDGSVSIHPSAHAPSKNIKKSTSPEKERPTAGKAVDALLMAAYAMTELNSGGESNKSPPATPEKSEEEKKFDTPPALQNISPSTKHTPTLPVRASPKRNLDETYNSIHKKPMIPDSFPHERVNSNNMPGSNQPKTLSMEDSPSTKRSRVGGSGQKSEMLYKSDTDNNFGQNANTGDENDNISKSVNNLPETETSRIPQAPPTVNETPKDKSTKVSSVLTPVSARCIDFQNMGVSSARKSPTTNCRQVES